MPDGKQVLELKWGRAREADRTLLHAMKGHRPYHLVNTNLVSVDSEQPKLRGRGGDSFVLAPLHCGGTASRWHPTAAFDGGELTLSTAMAVSAAAVNPNTGPAGKGVTRSRLVSLLMGLLNLRLGYWTPNPRFGARKRLHPNFISPGLGRLLGGGQDERPEHLELTDGGHFENLALYELFRRRVKVIVASDAGADSGFKFGDLANAVERARVDFGVKVRFHTDQGLDGLRPGSAEDDDVLPKEELAKRGWAVADIWYAKQEEGGGDDEASRDDDGSRDGVLFYIKTTLVPGLPGDVMGNRLANPSFPDQSTADQFFDEAQFEAYRELGYQITDEMLNDPGSRLKEIAALRSRDPVDLPEVGGGDLDDSDPLIQ